MDRPHISVVTPVYGCNTCLNELYFRLRETLEQINPEFEIILVNDASPDSAWETILELANKDKRIKGINLSRNFGQHCAITAGLQKCLGEWVVVIDCDLQDQPEEILSLYNKTKEGFDVVLGKRNNRQDGYLKKAFSQIFDKTLSYLTDSTHDFSIANFGIYKKKVIQATLSMNDSIRYFPTMIKWVGFKSVAIEVRHSERLNGETSYSFKKRLKLAVDIILSFSDKPLRLTVKFGLLISFSSLIYAFYNLYRYLVGQVIVSGWTSLIVSIWFLFGIIIFVLGTIGLYVGKTFEKVKQRPIYIVTEKVNLDE